ncbi:energy transducer TonB [Geothrix campi]|jgi:hypothetical protein|uniref:energy transducer TonB n=1 Tax=Geothrix campi TaxID=2966450 RepID=UPI0021488A07|nr:energy transducer TonB [Geothrix sp. SG10]
MRSRLIICSFALGIGFPAIAETPAKVIHSVAPEYPPLARMAQLGGVIDVDVSLKPDGSVGSVLPMPDTNVWKQLFFTSSEAAKKWVFMAGSRGPVRITFVYQLFPKGTDESHLKDEFIPPATFIKKAVVVYVDRTPMH